MTEAKYKAVLEKNIFDEKGLRLDWRFTFKQVNNSKNSGIVTMFQFRSNIHNFTDICGSV